jgi:hypothetical protein
VKLINLVIAPVLLSVYSLAIEDVFYASMDEDNQLKYISMNSDEIRIHKNSSSIIDKLGYYQGGKNGSTEKYPICNGEKYCFDKFIDCSRGLLANKMNPNCNSKFYSLSNALIIPVRNDDGTIHKTGTLAATTFFTPIATMLGNVAIEKYFNDTYNNFINKYSLEVNKNSIFEQWDSSTYKYNACDISILSTDDVIAKKKKSCKYEKNEGLFVFDGYDGTLLSQGNAKFMTLLSASELKNSVLAANKITQLFVNEYLDMEKLYPTIALPEKLPEVRLEKTEFETLKEFESRKTIAIKIREDEQKKLNEEYISKVKKRNENIFSELQSRNKKLISKIDEFRIQAFLAVMHEPRFEYISYDAETKKLFGWLANGQLKQKVILNISPDEAKDIKENDDKINPIVEYKLQKENDLARFEVKKLILNFGRTNYEMFFTDINYQPTYSMVSIPSYDIKSFDKSIKEALQDSGNIDTNELKALQNIEQWRVKSMAEVSGSTVVYTNAKAPNWYENIECENKICGVGRATTQEEALKIAMNQVGCSVKSSVSSRLNIEKRNNNGYLSKVSTYDLKQTCDNQFENGEISITNSAEMDGWYYIRTVLNKK